MGELIILASSGDQKVIWDPENDDEVEVAEMTASQWFKKENRQRQKL